MWKVTFYPEAEVVVSPGCAVLVHWTEGGSVAQVMVSTDKHQRDGGICGLQDSLQVPYLTFPKGRACQET